MKTSLFIYMVVVGLWCGCSDAPTPQPQPSPPPPVPESKAKVIRVESLLDSVAAIEEGQASFELFVPAEATFTLKGKPMRKDAAFAVVLDKILEHDLFPAGFEEKTGGRLYKYRQE